MHTQNSVQVTACKDVIPSVEQAFGDVGTSYVMALSYSWVM